MTRHARRPGMQICRKSVLVAALLRLASPYERAAAGEEPAPGMTPPVAPAGNGWRRPTLSRDWGGVRQRLADRDAERYEEIALTKWAASTIEGQRADRAIKGVDDGWRIGSSLKLHT